MSSDFSYSTHFILDKVYFTECHEQSVVSDHSWQAYFKAIFFSVFGGLLVIFTPINPYVAWFLFALGIVEALSVRYQKAWWVTRQMLGKASKGKVTLTINEQGIHTQSFYLDEMILWSEITKMSSTDKGIIFEHLKGKNYISARFLSNEALSFLQDKAQNIDSKESLKG